MPSRHSSSSHSSHSSHSHSSHRSHSSSSHSSSYSSSRSSHSRSSHSSVGTPSYRKRTNQPLGYVGTAPKMHRCKNHDYSYYPDSWTDAKTGKTYQAGYYDENGNFYEDVVITSGGVIPSGTKVLCRCEYCRSKVVREWQEGEMDCPNCGGTMQIISHMDEKGSSDVSFSGESGGKKSRKLLWIILAILLAPCILGTVIESVLYENDPAYLTESDFGDSSDYSSDESFSGDKLFLKKTEDGYVFTDSEEYKANVDSPDYKRLVLDDDGNYYDADSGMYVYYNTDISPAQYQYWIEEISSDYPDTGWMEYDEDQGRWYIEVSPENWEVLPDKYDVSKLWHIHLY